MWRRSQVQLQEKQIAFASHSDAITAPLAFESWRMSPECRVNTHVYRLAFCRHPPHTVSMVCGDAKATDFLWCGDCMSISSA